MTLENQDDTQKRIADALERIAALLEGGHEVTIRRTSEWVWKAQITPQANNIDGGIVR